MLACNHFTNNIMLSYIQYHLFQINTL